MPVEPMPATVAPSPDPKAPPPPMPSASQEMDHRVANSLQMVSIFLSLQRREVRSEEAREALGAAILRISAIAGVHRQLYRAAQTRMVDLARYLTELVGELEAGCGRGPRHGRIRIEAEPITVAAKFASMAGILVTELVMNACKHAYEPDETGDVDVRLASVGAGEFRLEVQDYGSRGRSGADHRAEGLGRHIIDTMARQLGIRHGYVPAPRGTRFVVSGPVPAIVEG